MVVRVDIGHGDRSKTARCLFVEILPCKLKSLGPYSTDTKEFSSEEKCAILQFASTFTVSLRVDMNKISINLVKIVDHTFRQRINY